MAIHLPGDETLLERCIGPTLDIGCGPGRLAAALAAAGVRALGVDVSPQAVASTRARGGSAVCRSVFDVIPQSGRWTSALLADGNIGIGGNPVSLLRRARSLITPNGTVYAEVGAPGTRTARTRLQFDGGDGVVSHWFAWAEVSLDAAPEIASRVGLRVVEQWTSSDRWFVAFGRPRSTTSTD